MTFLITGGCGFVGSNLAAELIAQGEELLVVDNLSRPATQINLAWLKTLGEFEFFQVDTRDSEGLERIFGSHEIECVFHLAGQVAMTSSLQDPRHDFEVNVLGSINMLECVRLHAPEASLVYASSNKVYGEMKEIDLIEKPTRYEPAGKKEIDEHARLEFVTPYGCSKGAADQYMQEYARNFGLNTVVFRHSTIYGGRQSSTFDQGWIGWFCRQALDTVEDPNHSFTINGDGKQVRDLLHVSDAVACYLAAHKAVEKARGHAFNIGGGYENSMSLLELFSHLEREVGVTMNPQSLRWRTNDQRYFVADNAKAGEVFGWAPRTKKEQGITDAITWERRKNSSV